MKKQTEYDKYTSDAGRRTEINNGESDSSIIATEQVSSKLTAKT